MILKFKDGDYFIHIDRYNHTLYGLNSKRNPSIIGYYTTLAYALKGLAKELFTASAEGDEDLVTLEGTKITGKAITIDEYLTTLESHLDEVINSKNWQEVRKTITEYRETL